ncbi:putative RNA helicase armitage [Bombus vancouverensis nearcticus]|uniref:putative RNA helicase armitage n=1 Tax=Bombus vancouverensis nearcticus TaxID=2705178 RepID=UPI00143927CA|nr:probable RNA helicase armi [Bombus vancouverensis nearcticus]
MFSFICTLIKYAIGHRSSIKDEPDEEINNVIARIENVYRKEIKEDESFNTDASYYKTGSISFIATDYIVVDDFYVYDIKNTSISNLKVGDKVSYLLSPKQDNLEKQHKIKKIFVLNESWDNEVEHSEIDSTKPETLTRCVIGKVIERKNRLLVVEPDNITVDLNKVQSDFIPVIGDWLQLESEVEIDEISYNLNGEILEIKRIQPLRSKLNIGTVTSFDPTKGVGVIEKDIVFNKNICDSGYIPCVGDKVISDSIESDQGLYTWRSLTVVPVFQVSKEANLPTLNNTSYKLKKDLNELVKNKCGIVISDNINIDLNVREEKNLTITIENVGNTTHVLRKGCFMIKKSHSQLILIQPITPNTVSVLNPSDKLTYIFKCTAKFIGTSKELFIFKFKDFEIGRFFNITVKPKTIQNKSNSKSSSYKTNYVPHQDEWNEATYIPGIRPCKPPSFIKVRNVIYKVPKLYWDVISKCINERKSQTECKYDIENAISCLSNRLSFQSYRDRFHALLYLEEIAQTINMQRYNISSTVMRHCGEYLVMEVPGLAEKRPSLLVGDRAIVSFKWDSSQGKLKYEGFIHKVTNLEIFLKFNCQFHQKYNYEDCQVTFKCSRSAIQRCHNAIDMATNRLGQNFLFPTHVIEKESQLDLEELEAKDKSISKLLTRPRTDSVSSESSSTSTTSTSNKSNMSKSFTKMSVVQRLFNVEPIEQNRENTIEPDVKDKQCIETKSEANVTKNSINTAIQNSKETSISSYSSELQPIISQVRKRKLLWFNKNLNHYQKEAVRNILKGHARPLPYVIFGPPGTGKTITLCETILQILSTIPESRLLVATPSNSSATLIAERLLDSDILKPGDMVRLIAYHCLSSDSIPSKLLPYCATAELADETTIETPKYNGVGLKLNCTMSILGRHRITIGTCTALGILNNMGFPHGHFSHILVDEAGQATEPEIMIPLSFIRCDYGQVILAGDPLQLGPVVQSEIAKNFGLNESFLSRLLRHFPYQKDPNGFETCYDPRLVTKLVINYRSLPEILELSSSLFYDSELKAQVSSKTSKEARLLQILATELPKRKDTPPAIIFHGVNGENCKDDDNPSWYNPEEATQVYLYLLKLYKCGISPDDIGIITPYQKQVLQIRELLMELDVELPKISSVEGFQGQERNVIIISTVRSSINFINEDIKHSLGFVACPRRLNVAITRGRALVIILGNPTLLAHDPYWRSVLIYCINHDSYTGCSFGFPEDIEHSWIETND